ncbi:MAG: iron-sulfur cluster assembly accessory protein [Deltaproteobacteria bacterium]|nr:MAG: iron-sulfur cluster assembly accessory protein [Deltaproteobacteria bacterium]
MIDITANAARQIKRLLAQHEGMTGLRIGVKGGGCSGLSYSLDLDSAPSAGDKVFEVDGIRVFIDLKSLLYLKGLVLDFQDNGLNGKRFTFVNPNARTTCGCGESFAV